MEGFLFPALYEFTQFTTGDELVADQLTAFRKAFARVNLSYARSKNLTPYDVLKIASMIEKETVAPRERKLVAAVIYNRLHHKMPARHRCHDPVRPQHPGNAVADEGGDPERQPVQQPSLPGPASDADRKPGPRFDQGSGAPGGRGLPLLRAHPGDEAPLLHGQRERVPAEGLRVRLRLQLTAHSVRAEVHSRRGSRLCFLRCRGLAGGQILQCLRGGTAAVVPELQDGPARRRRVLLCVWSNATRRHAPSCGWRRARGAPHRQRPVRRSRRLDRARGAPRSGGGSRGAG